MKFSFSHKRPVDRQYLLFLCATLYYFISGIQAQEVKAADKSYDDRIYEVFVIQERWHTGIVFNTADIDPDIWPEVNNYDHKNFIDIGWGDEKFYQATGNPVLLAARAVLWPTQSVLQIFPFSTPLRSAYGRQGIILRIPVTNEQLKHLASFVKESYKRDEYGNPQFSIVYGVSEHHFLATRKYHLFRTCNTWVALAFKRSGFKIRSFGILNARQLFRQLSRIPDAEFME